MHVTEEEEVLLAVSWDQLRSARELCATLLPLPLLVLGASALLAASLRTVSERALVLQQLLEQCLMLLVHHLERFLGTPPQQPAGAAAGSSGSRRLRAAGCALPSS